MTSSPFLIFSRIHRSREQVRSKLPGASYLESKLPGEQATRRAGYPEQAGVVKLTDWVVGRFHRIIVLLLA